MADSSVLKAGKEQEVIVGVDKSNEMILSLNLDKELSLTWAEDQFRELPEEIVIKLRPDNLRRYTVTETKVREKAKKAKAKIAISNPFNPLQGQAEAALVIRPRRGWHQCWKAPGRDFDAAMAGPYKQVRKPAQGVSGQDKEEEPGYETGEVKKLIDNEGKVELIACECPQELFDQYLTWMSEQSRQKFTDVKTDFFQKTEEINRMSGRGAQITPIDDSGELQA